MDVLRTYKGKTSVAALNMDLRLDVDELLPPIDTAELIELVSVKEGQISLTELGRKLLSSKMVARKALIAEKLRKTDLYKTILKELEERKKLSTVDVERIVESKFGPFEDVHNGVWRAIRWGVFADLFDYDGTHIIQHKNGTGRKAAS